MRAWWNTTIVLHLRLFAMNRQADSIICIIDNNLRQYLQTSLTRTHTARERARAHTHTHTQTNIHTHTRTRTHTHTRTRARTHAHTRTHTKRAESINCLTSSSRHPPSLPGTCLEDDWFQRIVTAYIVSTQSWAGKKNNREKQFVRHAFIDTN